MSRFLRGSSNAPKGHRDFQGIFSKSHGETLRKFVMRSVLRITNFGKAAAGIWGKDLLVRRSFSEGGKLAFQRAFRNSRYSKKTAPLETGKHLPLLVKIFGLIFSLSP